MTLQAANRLRVCARNTCAAAALLACLLFMPRAGYAAEAEGALSGYLDYEALYARAAKLAEDGHVELDSLGRTIGGREVILLSIGTGDMDNKPAIAIVGNVYAPHLAGSELALRIAEQLVHSAGGDDGAASLLADFTFYVIPRPSPDAAEAFFEQPYAMRAGNMRATDDDRDGAIDEDPPEDLNDDGWITMMRVHDGTGGHRRHPDDERVLIEVDPALNETPEFLLLTEGVDNDADEQWNEDGPGGVDFNRNLTFGYPYFEAGAGPHQVSEVETRAVLDFFFEHPNIAIVLSFAPEDNLTAPWDTGPALTADEGGFGETPERISKVPEDDAPYYEYVSSRYGEIREEEGAPPSADGAGSFPKWAYFHFGRWSFASRGWWIPELEAEEVPEDEDEESSPEQQESDADETGDEEAGDDETSEEESGEESLEKGDDRGAEEVRALEWFDAQDIEGFVDWAPVEHPDFPGKLVEAGGIKPFYLLNPPADMLDELAAQHFEFTKQLAALMPRIEIAEAGVEPLGAGLFRITAKVVNRGFLPTVSAMGERSRVPYPLQIMLELPQGAEIITGNQRERLGRILGNGAYLEHSWVVSADAPAQVGIKVWSPSVGADSITVELPSGEG